MQKPRIPKGTRDFSPEQMAKRNYIFNIIKSVFEKYGFQPLETPAMENLSVLTGKYGQEGDQLLFKILNSGDFLKNIDHDGLNNESKKIAQQISDRGLRYDLTVPLARYVVMNQDKIAFPFKRYQIQPVWRADRPQKGRYREFYQCDADVVGTDSLICEAESIIMINEVFNQLGITNNSIKINHRKVLTGIAEVIEVKNQESLLLTAIDKLDKIGIEKVTEELQNNGITADAINKLKPVFSLDGNNNDKIDFLDNFLADSSVGQEGIRDLKTVFSYLDHLGGPKKNLEIDITLARGLSYYTGTILEVKANNSSIKSSITGGGRYDNLTSLFGLENVSGIGFSFGVERIYDVMDELNLFNYDALTTTQLMVTNFDESIEKDALYILSKLRNAGISSEIFPNPSKIKKQLNYANRKNIPFVLMVGTKELEENLFGLKNMKTGEQKNISLDEIINQFN